MGAIDQLMREHEVLERALALLTGMARRLEAGASVAPESALRLIDFFSEYADGHHHAKEEHVLFPALVSVGLSADVGPVGVMLREHETCRALLGRMRRAAHELDTPVSREELVEGAFLYAGMLGEHIRKENFVLFPMAQRALRERIVAVDEACASIDAKAAGPGAALLDDIESALGPRRAAAHA
jgi:hemerythrin-like domain-containing protein